MNTSHALALSSGEVVGSHLSESEALAKQQEYEELGIITVIIEE